MGQVTAKSVEEALKWLHHNDHHEVGTEWPKCLLPYQQTLESASHRFYRNHFDKLRVPIAIVCEMDAFVEANRRPFDTRMYALTEEGRKLISANSDVD